MMATESDTNINASDSAYDTDNRTTMLADSEIVWCTQKITDVITP